MNFTQAMTSEDRANLLDLLCCEFATSQFKNDPALIVFAKQLPIYRTTTGAFVAVVDLPLPTPEIADSPAHPPPPPTSQIPWYTCPPHVFQPPPTTLLIAYREDARRLYQALGIHELEDGDVLTRFVLPQFGEMDADCRAETMEHLRSNWSKLRGHGDLLEAVREIPFVECAEVPGEARAMRKVRARRGSCV